MSDTSTEYNYARPELNRDRSTNEIAPPRENVVKTRNANIWPHALWYAPLAVGATGATCTHSCREFRVRTKRSIILRWAPGLMLDYFMVLGDSALGKTDVLATIGSEFADA